jgi:hypothetical protein
VVLDSRASQARPSFHRARAEPIFSARGTNEPAQAELIWSELKAGSHRAQPELARVALSGTTDASYQTTALSDLAPIDVIDRCFCSQ